MLTGPETFQLGTREFGHLAQVLPFGSILASLAVRHLWETPIDLTGVESAPL